MFQTVSPYLCFHAFIHTYDPNFVKLKKKSQCSRQSRISCKQQSLTKNSTEMNVNIQENIK